MRTHRHEREAETSQPPGFVDITPWVEDALAECGIQDGRVLINSEDGCSIVINELETGLIADAKRTIGRLTESDSEHARRIGSSSVVLPAEKGRLRLGIWQRILLLELERSCSRSVSIQITGD
jgi:thiamine phosphate synthase YjbQ (UPF0047 family)